MKLKLLVAILASGAFFSCNQPPIEPYSILPQPQEISYTPGHLKLKKQPVIVHQGKLTNEASLLASYLKQDFSIDALVKIENTGEIILTLDSTVLPGKNEGYLLDASGKKIIIRSSSPAGILNGIQTLRQLIQEKDGKLIIQKATITDYPAFSWRAFMLDEGRYFKGKKVVLELLDRMAELKMNVLHWHLTDDQGWRIEIKKYPKLTEIGAWRDSSEINHFNSNIFDGKKHGGFYTQEEIREVVAYAAQRHITVVPEIEMPGHASAAIAAYPWLGTENKPIQVACKFGVQYDVFNVTDPQVIQFLEDVMEEVITLFPAPVFHIGGDEVRYNQWKASPKVRSYMAKHQITTPAGLQIAFTNGISNKLASRGRRMMGWNEITGAQINSYQKEAGGAPQQQLAPGTIVHFWKGDPELIRETIEKGYDIVNSYHIYTYLDYNYNSIPLQKAYQFNPVPEGLTETQKNKVLGLGCQMWGEFIPTTESMNKKIFPRIAAYAETGWTLEANKDYERFSHALDVFSEKWSKANITLGQWQ